MYYSMAEMSVAEMSIGRNVRGRNIRGRNVRGRNVRGRNVRAPFTQCSRPLFSLHNSTGGIIQGETGFLRETTESRTAITYATEEFCRCWNVYFKKLSTSKMSTPIIWFSIPRMPIPKISTVSSWLTHNIYYFDMSIKMSINVWKE